MQYWLSDSQTNPLRKIGIDRKWSKVIWKWSKVIETDWKWSHVKIGSGQIWSDVVGNGLELVGNVVWFYLTSQPPIVFREKFLIGSHRLVQVDFTVLSNGLKWWRPLFGSIRFFLARWLLNWLIENGIIYIPYWKLHFSVSSNCIIHHGIVSE